MSPEYDEFFENEEREDPAWSEHDWTAKALFSIGNVNIKSKTGMTPILVACCRGALVPQKNTVTLATVKELLRCGANPNEPDNNGWTCLHAACSNGNWELVQLLLQHKVDVNARDKHGVTPLLALVRAPHHVFQNSSFQRGALTYKDANLYKCLCVLFKHFADVAALDDISGASILHVLCASDEMNEIVEWLLSEKKLNVNSRDIRNNTPLHYATPRCSKTLINHKANVNAIGYKGRTPLMCALLQCHNVSPRQEYGDSVPLPSLRFVEQTIVSPVSLNYPDWFEGSASAVNDWDQSRNISGTSWDSMLDRLLTESDVNLTDYFGMQALHYAAGEFVPCTTFLSIFSRTKDVNKVDHKGETAFHKLIHNMAEVNEVVTVAASAKTRYPDPGVGSTTLEPSVMQTMLAKADVNVKNLEGLTPFQLALKYGLGHPVCVMMPYYSHMENPIEISPPFIFQLVEQIYNDWMTSGVEAQKMMSLIISMKDINVAETNQLGQNILHQMALYNFLDGLAIVKSLFTTQQVNLKDCFGMTPLHYACLMWNPSRSMKLNDWGPPISIQILLQMGAATNIQNKDGKDCRFYLSPIALKQFNSLEQSALVQTETIHKTPRDQLDQVTNNVIRIKEYQRTLKKKVRVLFQSSNMVKLEKPKPWLNFAIEKLHFVNAKSLQTKKSRSKIRYLKK